MRDPLIVVGAGVSHRRCTQRHWKRRPGDLAGRDRTTAEPRASRQECLRHIIPLGERHLRSVIHEFVEHFHAERNHQGLRNVIPFPSHASPSLEGRIRRREMLAGLLSFYEREAA